MVPSMNNITSAIVSKSESEISPVHSNKQEDDFITITEKIKLKKDQSPKNISDIPCTRWYYGHRRSS